MKNQRKPSFSPVNPQFPPAWLWLFDEAVPNWVKQHYSPKESWKNKPFSQADVIFFLKGIRELSEFFTEERPSEIPVYFTHPKFRSSYLLYFLPLQAAKFLAVFNFHPDALQSALDHGRKTGVLRIIDAGAGPGTASFAFLLWLLQATGKTESDKKPPKIELEWIDTNRAIMEDGKELVELLCSHFPKLRSQVSIRLHISPWWKTPDIIHDETSLVLLGNVLNESPRKSGESNESLSFMRVFPKLKGGGMLLIEPAARRSSQLLSAFRDRLLEMHAIEPNPSSIWGPCLHAGKCPLAEGRDWCHFSVPTDIPGKWFKAFSRGLSSERQWVKFSYIWIASGSARAPVASPQLRRVVSDTLRTKNSTSVLICEPAHPDGKGGVGRALIHPSSQIRRGDLLQKKGPGWLPFREPAEKKSKKI